MLKDKLAHCVGSLVNVKEKPEAMGIEKAR